MGLYSIIRSARWLAVGYPADRYARFLDQSEHWPREQIEDYRNGKLHKLIAHCYENVPYYRTVMDEIHIRPHEIRRAEDLGRFPALTKDIVRNYSKQLLAKTVSEMAVTWGKTGGTTGEPMRICKNKECKAWEGMCHERGFAWGGKSVNEPAVRLTGGSLGIDKATFASRVGNRFRGDLLLPAFELRVENAGSYFDKIRRSRCRFLVGYASALYRLAMLAKEFDQKIEFTAAFPTAELMLPEWEETIRSTFKCLVLPYYGGGEVDSTGYSAPDSTGYLIPEEHALIEVMQGNDTTQLYGDGRFLLTDLDNYAMPMIRYANGDAGKVSGPDGHFPFSRIERLDGRYNSFLMTDSGDLISGVIGTHVFRFTSSVKSYRIIQEEPLRITIKVVPRDGKISVDDERLVLGLFTKYLGNKMKITIEIVPSLPVPPSGKSVFVVNHCLQ
jgi:phenylacetate-coenzyme A ligase PaaK-like adenylate-forming protein